jgi:hypothetical protein
MANMFTISNQFPFVLFGATFAATILLGNWRVDFAHWLGCSRPPPV